MDAAQHIFAASTIPLMDFRVPDDAPCPKGPPKSYEYSISHIMSAEGVQLRAYLLSRFDSTRVQKEGQYTFDYHNRFQAQQVFLENDPGAGLMSYQKRKEIQFS